SPSSRRQSPSERERALQRPGRAPEAGPFGTARRCGVCPSGGRFQARLVRAWSLSRSPELGMHRQFEKPRGRGADAQNAVFKGAPRPCVRLLARRERAQASRISAPRAWRATARKIGRGRSALDRTRIASERRRPAARMSRRARRRPPRAGRRSVPALGRHDVQAAGRRLHGPQRAGAGARREEVPGVHPLLNVFFTVTRPSPRPAQPAAPRAGGP
ncbi:unnamed protein product, partial [Prorocentrum cordatum]